MSDEEKKKGGNVPGARVFEDIQTRITRS